MSAVRADGRGLAARGRVAAVIALAALATSMAACATARPAPPAPTATLVVTCSVPDASLFIDDGYAGLVASWGKGGKLVAGFHRVEVRHPGHFSFYAEVTPRAGEVIRLAPMLRPTLD